MRWVVTRLRVLNPIRFTNVRRNEVDCKIPAGNVKKAIGGGEVELGIAVEEHRQQWAAMVLKDVCYGIEAYIEVLKHEGPEDKPEAKHLDQFNRRARSRAFSGASRATASSKCPCWQGRWGHDSTGVE